MSTTNLARDAFDCFYSGTHDRCGELLEQITGIKGGFDVKVAHNTILNDYYKSGCSDPQALLEQLTQAHDRARERDKKDKGRRKRDEDEADALREEEDRSILKYNQALLCLQLRHYVQATLILEELFENIEPIDDFLAIKICFLLLELYLLQRKPEQAVAVIAYLEKPNAFLTVLRSERPKTLEPRPPPEEVGVADEGGRGSEADEDLASPEEKAAWDAAVEDVAGGASARLSSTTETGGNHSAEPSEGPLPSLAWGAFLPRHGRAPDTISRAEYRFFCLMYRARLAVALRNTKAAKKDVKSAMEVLDQELRQAPLLTPHPHATGANGEKVRGAAEVVLREALQRQHHAMVFTLKAYLEYTRQNVRKAIKFLTMCQGTATEGQASDEEQVVSDFHPAQDETTAAVFFNNLGCLHFLMRKPGLATMYFQKALQASHSPPRATSETAAKSSDASKPGIFLGAKTGPPLPGVLATKHWLDRRAEVAYNTGMQMLMCERPRVAFQYFEQCVPVFRTWPRLWLRLAECCVEMHRQALAADGGAGEVREEAVEGFAAAGSGAASTAWSREAACPAHLGTGSLNGRGGMRSLVWGMQGSAAQRRWLLTTTPDRAVGRRLPPASGPGEQEEEPRPKEDGLIMGGESPLSHAAMCLRNVLMLIAPLLPEREAPGTSAAGTGSSTTPAAGGAVEEAAGAGSDLLGGASRAMGAGSAAAAAAPAPAASTSSGAEKARDLLASDAALLESVALVKLAYVCLCQRDHAMALRYSRRLLELNHLLPVAPAESQPAPTQSGTSARTATPAPPPQSSNVQAGSADEAEEMRRLWTFQAQNLPASGTSPAKYPSSAGCTTLAVMYLAEALLLAGKLAEARLLLGGFVASNAAPKAPEPPSGFYSAPNTGTEQSQDGANAVLVMDSAAAHAGDMQCMLYTNLAALHAQEGNLAEAQRCCERATQVQPRALAPLRTLIYILLRKGLHAEALAKLKQSRVQQSHASLA